MKKPQDCLNMQEIRAEIDAIDQQIVALISERGLFVHQAATFKTDEVSVKDEERVKAVIDSKKKLALSYGISPELIGSIYQLMINHFIQEEMKAFNEQQQG